VFFIHCDRCDDTLRVGGGEGGQPDPETAIDLEAFHAAHARCSLRFYEPTGRATASGPWHEPLVERRLEVRDRDGLALAVGRRTSIEEPLAWRIEDARLEEETEIALDEELFWDCVDRVIYPSRVPQRQVAAWVTHLTNHLRAAQPTDVVVLYDDVRDPDQSAACLTVTARAPLEASLPTFGFDPGTAARVKSLFDDPEFPPLRVRRRLVTSRARRRVDRAAARLDSPERLV